ncbi:MAG: 4-hydroxy-tetrahydrodipicolinate reductase [Deltaproteobacteria bacterium]|nr:4-hydroxy-tetrahydrodipicolinate reductase [Deltaproteobacteria bacterium]
MVNVILAGPCGRMGVRIATLLLEEHDIKLTAAFEKADHPAVGEDLGDKLALSQYWQMIISGDLTKVIDQGDVIIDFTHHTASLENLRIAAAAGKPMVIGTTGFTEAEKAEAAQLATRTKVVLAPNMSVGVNLMFKLVADMAAILDDSYDAEIVEIHHRLKKDAPSGTAMKLAEVLAEARQVRLADNAVYHRQGMTGERPVGKIGIQTLRAGDVTGEHTVIFGTTGERLEITHKAHNRDNFAKGAIRAAKWIVNQPHGLYDMMDVLNLR